MGFVDVVLLSALRDLLDVLLLLVIGVVVLAIAARWFGLDA